MLLSIKFLSPYNALEFSDVSVSSTKIDLAERQRRSSTSVMALSQRFLQLEALKYFVFTLKNIYDRLE